MDPESLERQNDQNIGSLGDRVSLLRQVSWEQPGVPESTAGELTWGSCMSLLALLDPSYLAAPQMSAWVNM